MQRSLVSISLTLVFGVATVLSVAPLCFSAETTAGESRGGGYVDSPEAVVRRYLELQGSGDNPAAQDLFDHSYFLSQAFLPAEWSRLPPELQQEALRAFRKGLETSSVFRWPPGTKLEIALQGTTGEMATVMVQNPSAGSEFLLDLRRTEEGWRIWNIRNEQTGLDILQETRNARATSSSGGQQAPSPFTKQAELFGELEALHHQAVVIAELSQQFDFIGYLEGISRPGPVVARVKGLFPRTTMPAALWRDATRIQGALTVAPSKTQPKSSDLLVVDALVSSIDLAFARYDGSSNLVAQDQLESVRGIPSGEIAVKLVVEKQLDGQWGFVLPDDRKEFERRAAEMGL